MRLLRAFLPDDAVAQLGKFAAGLIAHKRAKVWGTILDLTDAVQSFSIRDFTTCNRQRGLPC
jgi:hypothetical protein